MVIEKQQTRPGRFRALMRVPVPWVFVLAYMVGVALERAFPPGIRTESLRGITAAGIALFAAGAVIAGWGLVLFRRARTTTTPGKISARLVTWGPYGFTRNPMYVGLVLAYVGEAAILKHIWPLVLLPLVVAYLHRTVIPVEEARLAEVFQERYEAYRGRVRRWL